MRKIFFIIFKLIYSYKFNWYYNNKIHNFGNIGLGGKFHAFCAPYSSKIIDKIAYNGENIRLNSLISTKKYLPYNPNYVLDIGCGAGMSTQALKEAFPVSKILGIDCSLAMLKNCKKDDIIYIKDYAHKTKFMNESFDFINSMFLLHEVPQHGRKQILEECYRLLKPGGYLNIMDIRLNYKPNKFMLSGEPYLNDYLKFFYQDIINSNFFITDKVPSSDKRLELLLQK